MIRVEIKPKLLRWAREGADMDWIPACSFVVSRNAASGGSGEVRLIFKQLKKFAKTVHMSLGFFFLSKPPVEPVPIPAH